MIPRGFHAIDSTFATPDFRPWIIVIIPPPPPHQFYVQECARARLVKVDVEGGEWAVLQGMGRLLVHGRNELEVVVEVTPRWLALSGASVQGLFDFMRGFGYNAYVLAQDSYEISGAFPVVEPPLPRRVHRWEDTGSSKQADVIFSRRDVSILS